MIIKNLRITTHRPHVFSITNQPIFVKKLGFHWRVTTCATVRSNLQRNTQCNKRKLPNQFKSLYRQQRIFIHLNHLQESTPC